jgi:hypothetical protein
MKLDIASGQAKIPEWRGIDSSDGLDIIHTLDKYPWPIEDGVVEEARTVGYIQKTKNIMAFMNEVYRILTPPKEENGVKIPGGKILVVAPYYTSSRAWQDPYTVRAITESTFLYYNKDWRVLNKLEDYPITCDFDFTYGYAFDPEWNLRSEETRNFAVKHYHNVITDIQVVLTKK